MEAHDAVVQEWLTKSENDFKTLSGFMNRLEDYHIDMACFCAQQSIEKLLKALLVFHRERVEKTHDLEDLAILAQKHVPSWQPDFKALDRLTYMGIAARYPGVLISQDYIHEAYRLCLSIRSELLPCFTAS